MTVQERFLRYVSCDTQSNFESQTFPSTETQIQFGAKLALEMKQVGLQNVQQDANGYVYGWLPATPGLEDIPGMGLIAHMDTSPSCPGGAENAHILQYTGGDICLNAETGLYIRAAETPALEHWIGTPLIVTDGTTLLGADDKAGIAEILTAIEAIQEQNIRHGRVAVCFTPDEEIGRGADRFPLKEFQAFGAEVAYTVDGGELGQLQCENFNAAGVQVVIHGVNFHPGESKGKMKNALLIGVEFAASLPPTETPAHTEGYEGFYHLQHMEGDETTAILDYLIRDHAQDGFQHRKETMQILAAQFNEKYGAGTIGLTIRDQYYNMRPRLENHMDLINHAETAFRRAQVAPKKVPVRGGTDGARLSYEGLPCPNLSTGGYQFHSLQEWIPVNAMEKMVAVLVFLMETFACSDSE